MSNNDIFKMAEIICEAIKKSIEMPPDKVAEVDFKILKDDWYYWLEENINNCSPDGGIKPIK